MSDIEMFEYFERVAKKLEGVAQELARSKNADREIAGRIHLIAEAIRGGSPIPRDMYESDCGWDLR